MTQLNGSARFPLAEVSRFTHDILRATGADEATSEAATRAMMHGTRHGWTAMAFVSCRIMCRRWRADVSTRLPKSGSHPASQQSRRLMPIMPMARWRPIRRWNTRRASLISLASVQLPSAIPPISARREPIPWMLRSGASSASPSATPTALCACMTGRSAFTAPIRSPLRYRPGAQSVAAGHGHQRRSL